MRSVRMYRSGEALGVPALSLAAEGRRRPIRGAGAWGRSIRVADVESVADAVAALIGGTSQRRALLHAEAVVLTEGDADIAGIAGALSGAARNAHAETGGGVRAL